MSTRARRARQHRQVPLSDADLARFRAELPGVIAHVEQRVVPGQRRWALGAIAYGAMTSAGLLWYDWSPALVLVHVFLSQWIPLGAEIAALRRLQRRGMTRVIAANHVLRFVDTVASALSSPRKPWDPPDGPRIPDRHRLDSDVPSDSTDKTSPGALASTLTFLGLLGTALLIGALWFLDGAHLGGLDAQPWALLGLGLTSLLQAASAYRAKLVPPAPGASWNVDFHPGVRVMSVVLLGMVSPVLVEADARQLFELALAAPVMVAAWGLVTLLWLPQWRRTVARWRRCAGVDAAELRALWSRRSGERAAPVADARD